MTTSHMRCSYRGEMRVSAEDSAVARGSATRRIGFRDGRDGDVIGIHKGPAREQHANHSPRDAYEIPISCRLSPSRFQMALCPFVDVITGCSAPTWDGCMPLPENHDDAADVPDRLRDATAVTSELLSHVIASACRRFPSARTARKDRTDRAPDGVVGRTDAVLALFGVELPQWKVRRIAYDEGEWHCALSRERELPEWLDQSIEAHHPDLPLAILYAFVDARLAGRAVEPEQRPGRTVRRQTSCAPLCCDNFN